MIFVLLVRSFVRAFVCCSLFVGSLVRFFAGSHTRGQLIVLERLNEKQNAQVSRCVLHFAVRACPHDFHDLPYNLRVSVLLVAPR